MELTKKEEKLVMLLAEKGYNYIKFTRGESKEEFDIHMEGTCSWPSYFEKGEITTAKVSAFLPLAGIRELVNWCSDEVAIKCSYPTMAKTGDWSAIRDSNHVEIMDIFNTFVVPQLR